MYFTGLAINERIWNLKPELAMATFNRCRCSQCWHDAHFSPHHLFFLRRTLRSIATLLLRAALSFSLHAATAAHFCVRAKRP